MSQAHVLGHRQRRYQRQILIDESKTEAPCFVSAHRQGKIGAERPNASTGSNRLKPGQYLYQCRFAGTICPGAGRAPRLDGPREAPRSSRASSPPKRLDRFSTTSASPGRSAGRGGSRGQRFLGFLNAPELLEAGDMSVAVTVVERSGLTCRRGLVALSKI